MLALSWSGGKDSALALEALREAGNEPGLLLSTIDSERSVVPHHDVPVGLLRQQAELAGLPLVEIGIPAGSANETYEERLRRAFADGPLAEVSAVAFGDLFFEDLRAYREARLEAIGRRTTFPLWGRDTHELAVDFVERFEATVCAVDLEQFPDGRPGVPYDLNFVRRLPDGVDACGENGEFHTFVHGGPVLTGTVELSCDETVKSDDGRFLHARITDSVAREW